MSRIRHLSLESCAQQAVMDYGFTPFFNQAVEHQIQRLTTARPNKKDNIKDLTDLPWSSIDNIDSMDLDQLEYAERMDKGIIRMRIAIADVDHFVKRGDPVDKHASHNATSLYTGIMNFPMLPTQLSYDQSSLLPGHDRLAIVVEYDVLRDGKVKPGNVYHAWVHNKAKLIYESLGEWLINPKDALFTTLGIPELKEQLLIQHEASKRLKAWRQTEGMLEFESVESKPIIEDGLIKDLVLLKRTPAHEIIEQFMIAANQTMVAFLTKHQVPTIQRIVRTPERWGRIVEIAEDYGTKLPSEPDPVELRAFLTKRRKKEPETFVDLSLMIIKLIGRGEYEMVLPNKLGQGHFGLAVGNYTHSTAPNRRYVDLIIQRLVKAVLAGDPCPYTKRELVEHAAWCTERDAASKKVERFMRKVAAAMLLYPLVGHEFEGIITGSSNKGVYVRLEHPPAEGRIMRNESGLDVGDKVIVRLTSADPLKGHLDFQRLKKI